jgi:phytoene dehydrogenase-like protein
MHSSSKQSWEQWTKRKHGAVGGYPQWMNIKPWQLVPSRLIKNELYLCGDTSYPGQGIPGVCLSGIIAAKKMSMDLKLKINKRLHS